MKFGFNSLETNQIPFLQIPPFNETGLVRHGFSTRIGGVSGGPYRTLNLGLKQADERANVLENRRRFLGVVGLSLDSLVAGQQVHGTEVAVVTEAERGLGAFNYGEGLANTDALVTDQRGVTLSIYSADCVPLFFLDPITPAIGLAHAGWKGTVSKIGVATLNTMKDRYGTDPSRCLVGIGPSIGPCCYEVDSVVISPLQANFPYWQELVKAAGEKRWYFNLWETNLRQLVAAGVFPKNITVAGLCTACHCDTFFSYRADAKNTGSLAAMLALV